MRILALLLHVVGCNSSTSSVIGDKFSERFTCTNQTRTHAENMAEAVARASEPASVPALIGGGAGLAGQTSADLDRAIGVLEGFLTDERMARMQDVLDQRTGSSTMVFENPANPNNVSLLGLPSSTCLLGYIIRTRTRATIFIDSITALTTRTTTRTDVLLGLAVPPSFGSTFCMPYYCLSASIRLLV